MRLFLHQKGRICSQLIGSYFCQSFVFFFILQKINKKIKCSNFGQQLVLEAEFQKYISSYDRPILSSPNAELSTALAFTVTTIKISK